METVCSGHGNCSHGIAIFTCSCDPGYTGQRCETDIDDCVNINCSGQGNCTDRVNGFDCNCFPGYTDIICQTDIDKCDGINCSGNGRCVDMVNMFLYDCEPGYTGADCETNIVIVLIGTAVEMVCVWMVSTRSVVSVCLASLERCAVWRHKVNNTNFLNTLDSLFRCLVNAAVYVYSFSMFAFYTSDVRSDDAIATTAGGVVGGLVGVVMIAVVIVILFVIIVKSKRELSKYNRKTFSVVCTVT